jgi:hypothetical protein
MYDFILIDIEDIQGFGYRAGFLVTGREPDFPTPLGKPVYRPKNPEFFDFF